MAEGDNRPHVIRFEGLAGSALQWGDVEIGDYLESWDPEFADGLGWAKWTRDPTKAHRFATFRDAVEAWQAIPTKRPLRPDGRPNRPLTAFHVTFERIGEKP